MRRIAAFAALIFGLTALVAVPAVITASPASAACVPGVNGYLAGMECTPALAGLDTPAPAMMPCWNGTSVPVTSACPVAPSVPPVLVPPVCASPSYYEASSNSCKTPPTTAIVPSVPVCNAPAVYEASSNSCNTPTTTKFGAASCGPATWWNGTSCEPMSGYTAPTTTSPTTNCTGGWVLNPEQTSCIAPVMGTGGTTSTGATAPTTTFETKKFGAASCGPATWWNGTSCEPMSGYTPSTCVPGVNGYLAGSPCTAAATNAAISLCPAGSFFDQVIQGCKSATKQSATIACADGTFKVTALECSTFGGAVGSAVSASTGSTCANGYAPNSTGFCVPIETLAGNNSATSCGPAAWWNGTSCEPMTGYVGASVPVCGALTAWDGTKCAPTILVATAAGASLGGSCLDGYVASSAGICMPKGYDNGANMPASKNTGPISTSIDPCRVTPVPPSCIASGAVKVTESTVVQAQTARYGPPPPAAGAPANPGSGAQSSGGSTSTQFAAPPAKNGKAAAPVLIFNVLGSDNKALTDSNGKELTTRPAVKSGNTVFVDKSGSPVITAPTLDPSGRPVTGPDGAVLYTRLMTFAGQEAVTDSSGRAVTATPLLNGAGKALQASNGRVVYAPPVLDAKGNILLNSYGSPVLAQPLSDATGGIAVGPNGEPVVVQPMVAEGGKAILKNGQLIYVGGAGSQALTAKNESIQTAFGQNITFCNSGALADEGGNAVLGPDGLVVILSASGVPISANGAVLLDQKGKPIRVTANGGVTDSSGRPILGADSKQIKLGASEVATVLKSGKNVIKSSDGKTVTVGLNGQLVDTTGNPVLAAGNKAIFIDPKTKSFKDPSGKAITVSKTGVIAAKSTPLAYQTGALGAA